jgi:hypothetical protein
MGTRARPREADQTEIFRGGRRVRIRQSGRTNITNSEM